MGADIILSVLAVEKDAALDWSQVDPALDAMTLEELNDAHDNGGGDLFDTEAEARKAAREIFRELESVIEDWPRDLTRLDVRGGFYLYVSGGMSWGDMPTDTSVILSRAAEFDSVLRAVGFIVPWWDDQP